MSNFQRMTNLSWDVYSHFPHPNMGSRNCNSPLVLIIIMCLSFIFPQLTSKFSLKYSSYCPLILVNLSGVSWTCKCQFTVINKQQTKNRILHDKYLSFWLITSTQPKLIWQRKGKMRYQKQTMRAPSNWSIQFWNNRQSHEAKAPFIRQGKGVWKLMPGLHSLTYSQIFASISKSYYL